ncbi:nucleoside-diphosphate sugar epimerase/dehydratase [Acetobacterium sp.]|uniref:polysaccharide biosynthesis protein n=1 Tax=Acetobacterium sp. TaxID=1872094 RepID=UPI002F41D328
MNTNNKRKDWILATIILVVMDIAALFLSYYFAYLLRYNFDMPSNVFWNLGIFLVAAIFIKIVVFMMTGMYRTLWKFAGMRELVQIMAAVLFANVLANFMFIAVNIRIPGSVIILTAMIDVLFIGGIRMFYRVLRRFNHSMHTEKNPGEERTLIFGAGEAGVKMLKELMDSRKRYKIIGFLDDDPSKQGKRLNGIPIFGGRSKLQQLVEDKQITLIIIACPASSNQDIKEVAELATATRVAVKILPSFSEILNYDVKLSRLRDLKIEDLLDRDVVVLNKDQISAFIKDKVIMVTGGAGSIGSELCRQIIHYNPKKIIIVDFNENDLYFLELELQRFLRKLATQIQVVTTIDLEIASMRDEIRIQDLFEAYKPQVVFHAAAHKHVPLMEKTPKEAVKNNIFGTKNLLDACVRHHVEKFVQISTDKAVKPTNVMGTTKRVCEMLIQTYNESNHTEFVAVRFGNVLGSNGSVIPIFKEQIANGGPVTVTDKNITRFFMTIPEATQLVLQAGSIAKGGEIFVLDMGNPVKIVELAEKMIRLSGLVPYTEIPIVFTGLRPGEKLYEELSYNLKAFDSTQHKDIFVEEIRHFEKNWMDDQLKTLRQAAETGSDDDVVRLLQGMVPDYTPDRQA